MIWLKWWCKKFWFNKWVYDSHQRMWAKKYKTRSFQCLGKISFNLTLLWRRHIFICLLLTSATARMTFLISSRDFSGWQIKNGTWMIAELKGKITLGTQARVIPLVTSRGMSVRNSAYPVPLKRNWFDRGFCWRETVNCYCTNSPFSFTNLLIRL